MKTVISAAILGGALLGFGTMVQAQGMSLGEFEYRNSCVQCHGPSGKGDGPVTDFLSGAVPSDLTVLQKNNGGIFPVSAVFALIEGSDVASVHGTRDMPIWGERFRGRFGANDADFSPAQKEVYVGTRILALIEYLAGIQER